MIREPISSGNRLPAAVRPLQAGRRNAPRHRGFTLIELMVTIAVAAILLTIAVPAYRSLVENTGVSTEINELVGALNYARSTAVARGASVAICASTDQSHCVNQADWHSGWIIYVVAAGIDNGTPNQILRVHQALGSGVHLVEDEARPIDFNSSGFNMDPRKWLASTDNGGDPQTVCIAATGRVRVTDGPTCS